MQWRSQDGKPIPRSPKSVLADHQLVQTLEFKIHFFYYRIFRKKKCFSGQNRTLLYGVEGIIFSKNNISSGLGPGFSDFRLAWFDLMPKNSSSAYLCLCPSIRILNPLPISATEYMYMYIKLNRKLNGICVGFLLFASAAAWSRYWCCVFLLALVVLYCCYLHYVAPSSCFCL